MERLTRASRIDLTLVFSWLNSWWETIPNGEPNWNTRRLSKSTPVWKRSDVSSLPKSRRSTNTSAFNHIKRTSQRKTCKSTSQVSTVIFRWLENLLQTSNGRITLLNGTKPKQYNSKTSTISFQSGQCHLNKKFLTTLTSLLQMNEQLLEQTSLTSKRWLTELFE